MEEIEKVFLDLDRISVFIGKGGIEKKSIEKKFDCKIDVNSENGEVLIKTEDALSRFILANVISAINLGHNPKKALKLEDENFVIDIIDLKILIKRHDRLKSVIGRIIGKNGSTRKAIEEITDCSISIKDNFISVIGPYENTILLHEALEMLIKGSSHKSFYSYLERNKSENFNGLL